MRGEGAWLQSHRQPPPTRRSPPHHLPCAGRRSVVVSAKKPADFDELLEMVAEKFEAVENKPVVVGWLVGAFSAIVIGEARSRGRTPACACTPYN